MRLLLIGFAAMREGLRFTGKTLELRSPARQIGGSWRCRSRSKKSPACAKTTRRWKSSLAPCMPPRCPPGSTTTRPEPCEESQAATWAVAQSLPQAEGQRQPGAGEDAGRSAAPEGHKRPPRLSAQADDEPHTAVRRDRDEDVAVGNLMRNRHLSRVIADVGLRELRPQIAYKAPPHGGCVVFVDRFFPSSKRCRWCGSKNNALTRRIAPPFVQSATAGKIGACTPRATCWTKVFASSRRPGLPREVTPVDRWPLRSISALQVVWSKQKGCKPTVRHQRRAAEVREFDYVSGDNSKRRLPIEHGPDAWKSVDVSRPFSRSRSSWTGAPYRR